jgi:cytochrome c biogenesis protein ResB
LVAEQFEPDFFIDANRKVSSHSRNMHNPALRVGIYDGDKTLNRQWLFAREDLKAMMHGGTGPYQMELVAVERQPAAQASSSGGWRVRLDAETTPYLTRLSLTRNPTIPVIYVGCGLIMAGLLLVFVVRRREIYFHVDRPNQRLHVAGVYAQPQDRLDRATRSVIASLTEREGRDDHPRPDKDMNPPSAESSPPRHGDQERRKI